MIRGLRRAALAAFLLAVSCQVAGAQYYYPPGYGGYGWRGWGGGGGGSTVYGDQARGLGAFAAGAGVYNYNTSVARSINADTAMRWNEYLFQSQQATNRRYHEQMARRRNEVIKTGDAIYKRLHDNPTNSDIMDGDALNVALDEVTAPKVYTSALKGAKAKLAGAKIREIPFQYAAEALTTSVDDLTQNGPPALLDAPEFQADRASLKELRARFRELAQANKEIDPAIIKAAQGHIKAMEKTIKDNPDKFKKNSPPVHEAENYLKGLYGLVTMLETPAMNILLAGLDKRPDTTVGDLLGFMHAFNLRFGQAKTPQQRMVYAELYPILDGLRDEIVASGIAPTSGKSKPTHPGEFFSGMDYQHIDAKKAAPKPPTPGPNR